MNESSRTLELKLTRFCRTRKADRSEKKQTRWPSNWPAVFFFFFASVGWKMGRKNGPLRRRTNVGLLQLSPSLVRRAAGIKTWYIFSPPTRRKASEKQEKNSCPRKRRNNPQENEMRDLMNVTEFSKNESGLELEEETELFSSPYDFEWFTEGLFILIVGIVGLLGNCISIWTFSRQKVHRIFHNLLLFLAIFDIVSTPKKVSLKMLTWHLTPSSSSSLNDSRREKRWIRKLTVGR